MPNVEGSFIFSSIQQVNNLLIVELEVGASDNALGIAHSINPREELIERSLHEAIIIAHHCVGFAWPCLAIDKDTAIVSLKRMADQFFANGNKDVLLLGGWGEDTIECKWMLI